MSHGSQWVRGGFAAGGARSVGAPPDAPEDGAMRTRGRQGAQRGSVVPQPRPNPIAPPLVWTSGIGVCAGRRSPVVHPDVRIAAIAARQRGVVTRRRVLAAGLSRRALEHRLARGRLHRVFRGAYLVGHAVPPPLARETAALLVCGADAVAEPSLGRGALGRRGDRRERPRRRHRPAARLLAAGRAEDPPHDRPRRRRDPQAPRPARHVPRAHPPRPRMRCSRPAGSPTPTRRARTTRLVRPIDLHQALERTPRRRGSGALRRVMEDQPTLTRSAAERRLLDLVRAGGLPRPETNARRSPATRSTCSGGPSGSSSRSTAYAHHHDRGAFERDRTPRRGPPGRRAPRPADHLAPPAGRARGGAGGAGAGAERHAAAGGRR